MCIYISDLHIKEKEIYKRASFKFLNWLLENYKDEILIIGGDLFDDDSPHNKTRKEIAECLLQFKEVHILTGNHDIKRKNGETFKGNALFPLMKYDTIYVYIEPYEVNLDNQKCLFLPFKKVGMEEYSTLNWEGDFCFSHFAPIQEQFEDEGIDLSGIKATKIFGHIHIAKEYENSTLIIPGCPVITRQGEINNPILQIKDGIITKIQPPKFFDICDIEYGKEINTDYLYNIKNAPSYEAIYKMYPEINVRAEGITLIQKEDEEGNNIDFKFKEDSLKNYFVNFCKEKELSRTIASTGIKYMEKYS
jgi:hypothetical protein